MTHLRLTEMAICSMARVFVGTELSTFSAYIRRLRGYVGAPDTTTYFHTHMLDGPKPVEHRSSYDLFNDNPNIWEELEKDDD